MPKGNCEFKGTGGQYFVAAFIHLFLLTMITFGIYGAWAWVRVLRLKASHTVMNGKSVSFSGTGGQLFVLWIIQGLLTVITAGLYGPWAVSRYLRWRAQNTVVGGNSSRFTGSGGSLFLLFLIHLLILPLLTCGIYSFIGYFKYYAWRETNTLYGGERTTFGAGFGEFFLIILVGGFLNSLTFYLFLPWFTAWLFRWQVEGLAVGDGSDVNHFPPPKVGSLVVAIFIIIGLIPTLLILFMLFQMKSLSALPSKGNIASSLQMAQVNAQESKVKMKIRDPGETAPAKEKKKETAPATREAQKPVPKKPDAKPSPAKEEVVPPTAQPASEQAVKEEPQEKKIDYKAELQRLDKMISESKDKNADLYYNRAWIRASMGDSMEAIEDYEKAIQIDGKHADAYFNRGVLYAKLERYEMALRDFNRAIELNPKAYDALCNSGNVYYELGKYDLAVRDYTKALEIRPGDAELYKNRSVAYKALGENEKAKADEEKAKKLLKELTIESKDKEVQEGKSAESAR